MEDWPTSPEEGMVAVPSRSRFRWWIHLGLLTSYPIILGVVGSLTAKASQPLLPTDPLALLLAMGFELLSFASIFGLAWWASRATGEELLLKWRGVMQPLFLGLFHSINLRLGVFVVLRVMVLVFAGTGMTDAAMDKLRPSTEDVVSARALVDNPVYLLLNLTLVSFVVGGFREELWRAGMLAGVAALFPRSFQTAKGRFAAVGFAAVVFGLGHLTQGWGGVVVTTFLGVGLGWIMIHYRSIWEAALAHGFFDAASFALLYGLARFRPDLIGA